MAESNSKLLVGSAAVTLGVVAATTTYWWRIQQKSSKPTEFHVQVPPIKVPWAMKVMTAILPAKTRRALVVKGANPKPPLDGVDVLGDSYNPYTELGHELVPNKLWRVRYRSIQDPALSEAMKAFMGIDLDDRAALQRIKGPTLRNNMEQAMNDRAAMREKNKGLPKMEQFRNLANAGFENSQDMLVLYLEETKGLLLYNPCRMHPPVILWLQQQGDVQWIVSGSSSHTNQLPQAAVAFPKAKILCSQSANEKCQAVGMRPADYVYTDPKGLQEASEILKEVSGNHIRLVHIKGDTNTQNLCIVAYNHLLEVDLAGYGNGKRTLAVDENDWQQPSPSDLNHKHLGFVHLLYGASIDSSYQAGYLPDFRIHSMDPTSLLSQWMSLDQPQPDGSSCRDMAQSLRTLLRETDYAYVDSAHSVKRNSLPVEEFKPALNGMWNWLDGSSLLPQES